MNKKVASLLLALPLALWGRPAAAQAPVRFSFGPRVGYKLSTTHFTNHRFFKTSYRPGLEAGVTASLRRGHFALQPAACYVQKGYRLAFVIPGDRVFEALHYRDNTRLDYLVFPLNLAYSQHADGQGWQVFAGPYLGLLLRGRYVSYIAFDYDYTGTPEQWHESRGNVVSERRYEPAHRTNTHIKKVDAGLQGGLGYQYRGFLLQGTYSLGLRNVQYKNFAANVDYGTASIPYYNRSFDLSLAYLFGSKSRQ